MSSAFKSSGYDQHKKYLHTNSGYKQGVSEGKETQIEGRRRKGNEQFSVLHSEKRQYFYYVDLWKISNVFSRVTLLSM